MLANQGGDGSLGVGQDVLRLREGGLRGHGFGACGDVVVVVNAALRLAACLPGALGVFQLLFRAAQEVLGIVKLLFCACEPLFAAFQPLFAFHQQRGGGGIREVRHGSLAVAPGSSASRARVSEGESRAAAAAGGRKQIWPNFVAMKPAPICNGPRQAHGKETPPWARGCRVGPSGRRRREEGKKGRASQRQEATRETAGVSIGARRPQAKALHADKSLSHCCPGPTEVPTQGKQ